MLPYYRPIVTLYLKCTAFEIWRHIGRKSPKNPNPPLFDTFLSGDPLRIFRWIIPRQKLEWRGYQMVYILRSCFRCARHNASVWRTDVRTDIQTDTSLSQRPARVKKQQVRNVLWTRKGVRATVKTAGHCTHAELTSAHTFVLTLPTDLPSQIFH